jgi:hypothetical protein
MAGLDPAIRATPMQRRRAGRGGVRSWARKIHHEDHKEENQQRFARSAFITFVLFVSSW